MRKLSTKPHNQRRGRLKNDNPPGDFLKAPRCRAKTRRGTPCQCPAMRNGRCRLHGGLSTGPRTQAGAERCRKAATKHGRYSREARTERHRVSDLIRECRAALRRVS